MVRAMQRPQVEWQQLRQARWLLQQVKRLVRWWRRAGACLPFGRRVRRRHRLRSRRLECGPTDQTFRRHLSQHGECRRHRCRAERAGRRAECQALCRLLGIVQVERLVQAKTLRAIGRRWERRWHWRRAERAWRRADCQALCQVLGVVRIHWLVLAEAQCCFGAHRRGPFRVCQRHRHRRRAEWARRRAKRQRLSRLLGVVQA
mmetsp:Transcript_65580/g.182325  ORF Transcript_65580/g.182325 Transcript_65580/m.182325 type:complete len:203 (+) Transcript_65580:1183-1791(+)